MIITLHPAEKFQLSLPLQFAPGAWTVSNCNFLRSDLILFSVHTIFLVIVLNFDVFWVHIYCELFISPSIKGTISSQEIKINIWWKYACSILYTSFHCCCYRGVYDLLFLESYLSYPWHVVSDLMSRGVMHLARATYCQCNSVHKF